jgi:hypothetical protein
MHCSIFQATAAAAASLHLFSPPPPPCSARAAPSPTTSVVPPATRMASEAPIAGMPLAGEGHSAGMGMDMAGSAAMANPAIKASSNVADACYAAPGGEKCAAFVRADADWEADVASLCAAMSFMSGCTLWDQCEVPSGCRGHGVRACVPACVRACCLPASRCAGPWQRAATGLIPETLAPPLCLAGGRSNWRLLQARQHHRQPVHRHAQGGGQAQAGQTSLARRACC